MLRLNLYGSLAVLAVVGAIAVGLPSIDSALPAGRSLRTGERLSVGLGVTVAAPADAVLDVTKTVPSLDRLVFSVHSVRVVIEASRYDGALGGLSDRLRRKIQSNPGYETSQRDHPTTTTAGVAGLAGSYSTPGRNGTYAVFGHRGVGVEISMAGDASDLRREGAELTGMTRSVRFGAS